MLLNHDELIGAGWIYRPSPRYENHGIYWRKEKRYCHIHGDVEHVVVYGVSVVTDHLCRVCCQERRRGVYQEARGAF